MCELSHHSVEGLHLTTIGRPIVVSVLWEVDPPLCPGKFEVQEPEGWVSAYRILQWFLLNNFVCRGLGIQSGMAGLYVGRQQLDVTIIFSVRVLGP